MPRGLKAPLPIGGQAGVDGDNGEGDKDGTILLELANATGVNYLQDAAGVSIDQAFSRPGLSRVDRAVSAPIRPRAAFKPNPFNKDNTPILDLASTTSRGLRAAGRTEDPELGGGRTDPHSRRPEPPLPAEAVRPGVELLLGVHLVAVHGGHRGLEAGLELRVLRRQYWRVWRMT